MLQSVSSYKEVANFLDFCGFLMFRINAVFHLKV